MGLFPPFKGKEAGIYLHRKAEGKWSTIKALELPFAHRCEFVQHNGTPRLIAVAVSEYKENPDDWSQPGITLLVSPGDKSKNGWEAKIIDRGITRNHGMTRTVINGRDTLCVSGVEGVFSVDHGEGSQWQVKPIFEKEVSEVTFIDLDGDGGQ